METQAPTEGAPKTPVINQYSHFFEVKLGNLFDGPIDLLLHLVKRNELPIETLSLAEVAAQYMQCIQEMRELDLEVAGEYLVIAATLLSIKSSILLNEPVELVLDDEGNLVDPHEELLRRLREAQIYREGAQFLGGRSMLGVDVFEPQSLLGDIEAPEVRYKPHDAILLGLAFKALLKRVGKTNPTFTISVDSVTIVERMMSIVDRLRNAAAPVAFEDLVPDQTSRGSIISSFLALLELAKRQMIQVRQDGMFSSVTIALIGAESVNELPKMESEFDQSDEQRQVKEAQG